MTVDELKFDERGLLPAVVQAAETGEVLMVAWMDRAAVQSTLTSGLTHFWSRSRQAPVPRFAACCRPISIRMGGSTIFCTSMAVLLRPAPPVFCGWKGVKYSVMRSA